jgi:hypothetical protein
LKPLFDFTSGKGLFFTDGTDISEKNIPSEFILGDNYPNPFNPSTTISFQIAKPSYVTLKIYDGLGKEVSTLVDEYKQAGIYNLQFTSHNSEFAAGVYFYRLRAGEFISTKKMILLK